MYARQKLTEKSALSLPARARAPASASFLHRMIAFQWRPPWRELVAATCKHSRSIIKGKAPENCVCLQPPARRASSWTQVAFAGGAEASTSTSVQSSPDIDYLFFYPSFHFDLPRSKNRHLKHVRRALRRTLGLSRSMLPSSSTPHQIFAKTNTRPLRHASHSSAVVSNITSIDEASPDPPAAFPPLPYRKNRKLIHRDDRVEHDSSMDQPYYRQITAQACGPELDERPANGLTRQISPSTLSINAIEQPRLFFDGLVKRVHTLISSKAPLKRMRWRLYALLRLTDRYISYKDTDEKALRLVVLKVCQEHLKTNDITNIEEIVRRTEVLKEHHYQYSSNFQMYTILMIAYCRALRVEDARDLLTKLRGYNIRLNPASYLALVTMYAHLKDPENAQKMLEAMDRDNLPITQKVYASLMNAYVEAGFWNDAIQVFEFLDSHADSHSLKPDTYTCTTLMKCYVLMGAPLDEVMHIFNLMQHRGLEPRKKTYALVLHAACDAGALDFAEEVFAKLDEEVGQPNLNAVPFTIMIQGMLRAGKQDIANEYYQEMRRRGYEPTSTTWSVLMQAYGKAGKSENNPLMNDLLKQFLESHIDIRTGRVRPKVYQVDRSVTRGTALENVYGPVISSLAKGAVAPQAFDQGTEQSEDSVSSAQAAANMFRQMLKRPGSKPSLHLYTALLDAYRRIDDVAGVQELWPSIVAYGREMAENTSVLSTQDDLPEKHVSRSRRNLLCLPLSIYVEAMSSHHLHQEVAEAWQELQALGFGFDIGNWNHLIAAFVRAGEIDRALWIAEELLKDSRSLVVDRSTQGEDKEGQGSQQDLGQDALLEKTAEPTNQSLIAGDKTETPMRPPNRTWQFHQNRKAQILAQQAAIVLPTPSLCQQDISSDASDAQHQLLQQSPSLVTPVQADTASNMTESFPSLRREHYAQVWTLFMSTRQLLEDALRRKPAGRHSVGEVGQGDNYPAMDNLERRRAEQYPLTMAAIADYRYKMRQRGGQMFSRR